MTGRLMLADGRYRLVECLGEGGMASVYLGYDNRLQVWRAVKVLRPEHARRPILLRRFEAEARTMALLEHPHIARVYDVDEDDGVSFMVMELLRGGSLVDWLERHGPMHPRTAVEAVAQVARGLQYAHDHGVVHRDVKPHNVLLDGAGGCRVTDFGIARAGDIAASETKTGVALGTWAFMAPEQRSDAKMADARADVYGLAASLYALLLNRTPVDLFAADRDPDMLAGIPEALQSVIRHATRYDRDERCSSMAELSRLLEGASRELPDLPPDAPTLANAGPEDMPFPVPQHPPTPPRERVSDRPTILPDEYADEDRFGRIPISGAADGLAVGEEASGAGRASPRMGGALVLGLVLLGLGWGYGYTRPASSPGNEENPGLVRADAVDESALAAPVAPLGDTLERSGTLRELPATATVVSTPTPPPAETPRPALTGSTSPARSRAPAAASSSGAEQCIEDATARPSATSVAFVVKTCLTDRKVTLRYRFSTDTTWFAKEMVMRLGKFSAVLQRPAGADGPIEWFVVSAGASYGAEDRPKTVVLP